VQINTTVSFLLSKFNKHLLKSIINVAILITSYEK